MTAEGMAAVRISAWPPAEAVVVDGRRLAVHRVTAGSDSASSASESAAAPPVLLLHGLRGNGHEWGPLSGHLPPGRRLIAPDLPGLGGSEKHGGYALSAVATTLAALVEHEAGGPVDAIGHDWGATLAIALAAMHPDLVRRLGLIAGMWPPWLAAGPGHPAPGLAARVRRLESTAGRGRGVAQAYLQDDPELDGTPKPERSLVVWGTTPKFAAPWSSVPARRLSPRFGEKVVTALGRCVDPASVDMVTLPGGGYSPHVTASPIVGSLLCDLLTS